LLQVWAGGSRGWCSDGCRVARSWRSLKACCRGRLASSCRHRRLTQQICASIMSLVLQPLPCAILFWQVPLAQGGRDDLLIRYLRRGRGDLVPGKSSHRITRHLSLTRWRSQPGCIRCAKRRRQLAASGSRLAFRCATQTVQLAHRLCRLSIHFTRFSPFPSCLAPHLESVAALTVGAHQPALVCTSIGRRSGSIRSG
jgi:hypothetical protein